MPGYTLNENLVGLQGAQLADSTYSLPCEVAALYTYAGSVSATSTYSSLSPDTTTATDIFSLWTITASGGVSTATQIITFSSPGGGTYYGVLLYTGSANKGCYAITFPSSVTLAAGGKIAVTINLTFQQCA